MRRLLCASPAYLARHPTPTSVDDLADHDLIEMPGGDGRPRTWSFTRGNDTASVAVSPRVGVNEALTIARLVSNGAGIGAVSCYICAPEIKAKRLVHLLPDWSAPAIEVNLVFPSKRELAPAVRAFVNFMRAENPPGLHWQDNALPA